MFIYICIYIYVTYLLQHLKRSHSNSERPDLLPARVRHGHRAGARLRDGEVASGGEEFGQTDCSDTQLYIVFAAAPIRRCLRYIYVGCMYGI